MLRSCPRHTLLPLLLLSVIGAHNALGQRRDTQWLSGTGTWTDAQTLEPRFAGRIEPRRHSWRTARSSCLGPPRRGRPDPGYQCGGPRAARDCGWRTDRAARYSPRGEAARSNAQNRDRRRSTALCCRGLRGRRQSGTVRECRGRIRIRGGSFLCRLVTLGWGAGANAMLSIEGSRPSAVHVLDYVTWASAKETCRAPTRFRSP